MLYKELLWLIAQQSNASSNVPSWTPGTHTFSFVAAQDGSVSLFDNTTPDIHPVESFTVTINGVLTDQSYQSISFAANDEVVITGNDVVSFPKLVSNNGRYFASVSALPFMTSGKKAAACTSADRWFVNSSNLTTVPGDLFINNPYLYKFYYTFGRSGLVSIPPSLFEYVDSNKPLSFEFTFSGCTALTSIPSDLFRMCTNADSFSGTFWECSGLTSLPNDLFKTCSRVTDFGSTFYHCSNLTSLPDQLFSNNHMVKNFDGTFGYCTSLASLPENLFAGNSRLLSIRYTFQYCTNLSSIPENLFANNTEVTTFDRTFQYCTNLSSIPANLFANNTEVTDFGATFRSCTNLSSIPENLFANNTKVTNFDYTFYDCRWANTTDGRTVRLKIGSPNVTSCTYFCWGSGISGSITIAVPAGSTTEATFRAYAETDAKVVIETF